MTKSIDLKLWGSQAQTNVFPSGCCKANRSFVALELPSSEWFVSLRILFGKSYVWSSGAPRLLLPVPSLCFSLKFHQETHWLGALQLQSSDRSVPYESIHKTIHLALGSTQAQTGSFPWFPKGFYQEQHPFGALHFPSSDWSVTPLILNSFIWVFGAPKRNLVRFLHFQNDSLKKLIYLEL